MRRRTRTPREDRKCLSGEVEDEEHFALSCNLYADIRRKHNVLNSTEISCMLDNDRHGIIRPACKSIFNIHSSNLKYLFQLRGGLSPLNAHKFRHKFENTPSPTCSCATGAETTEHFLLSCPIFSTHRQRLMETVNPIVLKLNLRPTPSCLNDILLYGNESLDNAENKSVLEATLLYNTSTGRLSL